jgi:hypothetical protein
VACDTNAYATAIVAVPDRAYLWIMARCVCGGGWGDAAHLNLHAWPVGGEPGPFDERECNVPTQSGTTQIC